MFRVDVEQLFDATDAGGLYRGNFWSVVIGLEGLRVVKQVTI